MLENRVQLLETGMERTINDKIIDIITERMERENRKKNLMFFGLPEASNDIKGKDRAVYDMSSLRAMKTVEKVLEIKNSDVEFSYRVGKYDAKKTRPCVSSLWTLR